MASIRKTKTGYQYRICYKLASGKWTEHSKSGFKTERDALRAAKLVEAEMLNGFNANLSREHFPMFFSLWMNTFKKPSVSDRTFISYKNTLSMLNSHFNASLNRLTRVSIQYGLNKLSETYSRASLQKFHNHIKSCLNYALEERLIPFNPAAGVKLPVGTSKRIKDDVVSLSVKETALFKEQLLVDNSCSEVTRLFILLSLRTGMRYAELAGLTWDCINFKSCSIKVTKTWDYKIKKDFSSTKNKASMRTVHIDSDTCSALEKFRSSRFTQVLPFKNNNLVFTHNGQTPVDNSVINRALRTICTRAGIKVITCHSLRHTHASILIYSGVDPGVIAKRLGHANTSMTLNVYSHIFKEMEDREKQLVLDSISTLM